MMALQAIEQGSPQGLPLEQGLPAGIQGTHRHKSITLVNSSMPSSFAQSFIPYLIVVHDFLAIEICILFLKVKLYIEY